MVRVKKLIINSLILLLMTISIKASLSFGDTLNILLKRLGGADRYATSEEISKFGWQTSSNTAIITTGEDFPDALSSAPFAKINKAPVLITQKDYLNDKTKSELQRLKVQQVYIMGGTGAVSQNVEDSIKSMKIKTTRICGADRYETSVKIAERMNTNNGVVLVSGDDYPGALFMAPIAAVKGMPILLVQRDSMPDSVKNYLKNKKIPKYYVIGDENVVGSGVTGSLSNVERITGKDKYERNLNALSKFSDVIDFSKVYIATGEDFPDALTGSAMASMTGSPIILMVNKNLSEDARNFINSRITKVKAIYMLGGESVVAPITLDSNGIASDGGSYNNGSSGNSNGNIINGGYAASQGDYVYYRSRSSTGLFKMKRDGSQKVQLCKDSVKYINVLGNYVYYSDLSDNGKIYRIKTDGTDKQKIVDDQAEFVNVSGNYIYYSNQYNGGKIYRTNLDGSNRILINYDNSSYLSVDGDYLYYSRVSDFEKIYKIKNDGSNIFQLNYTSSTYVTASNGYVYYIDYRGDGDIYRVKNDGSERIKLNALSYDDNHVYSMNVDGNYIYYKVNNNQGKNYLYRIKTDGTEKTLISTEYVYNINIINGTVFDYNKY